MGALRSRLAQELKQLQKSPPPGVCAWPVQDKLNELEAQLCGPPGTVYEGGVFKLSVLLPERYPFEPPKIRFVTPVYHPNIDNGGRICLDILNMPPKGAWKPSLNICTVLASIGLLLSEPNADDGLMTDVTSEYKHDRAAFNVKAMQMTRQHATQQATPEQGTHPYGPHSGTANTASGVAQQQQVSIASSDDSSDDEDCNEDCNKKQRLC